MSKKKHLKLKHQANSATTANATITKTEVTFIPQNFGEFFKLVKENLLVFIIILAISALVYMQLFHAGFLNLDDYQGIVANPVIKSFSQVIKLVSIWHVHLAILYTIFKLNAGGFHASLIFFHALNVFLFFILTYVLFGKKTALVSALLFVVHPLASEAVCWLSGGIYLFTTLFTIFPVLMYVLYRKSQNKAFYITSIISFLVTLVIHHVPWLLTTPFLIAVIDQLILEKKLTWKNIKLYIPYIVGGLAYAAFFVYQNYFMRITALKEEYYFDPTKPTPVINRLPYIFYMVAKLLVFPRDLTIYHEGNIITANLYATMILVTLGMFVAWFLIYKKNCTVAALIMLIPVTTLPSFSPVAIAWFVAERYLYITTAFFCILLGYLLVRLPKKTATFLIILVISVYGYRTFIRTNDFISSKNLWLATMKVSPRSYRVYNNLGDVYAQEGNYQAAVDQFKKSIELFPEYADAVHNLGFTYMQMKDYDNARKYLEQSLQMNPKLYGASYKLGVLEFQQGNYAKAKDYFQKTLDANPGNPDATKAVAKLQEMGY